MPRVRLIKKVGLHRAGAVVEFDSRSAAALLADGRAEELDDAPAFDPTQHGAKAVNDYLSSASDAERHRVLAAERAGKARTTVLGV